jgi:hypothetical protein
MPLFKATGDGTDLVTTCRSLKHGITARKHGVSQGLGREVLRAGPFLGLPPPAFVIAVWALHYNALGVLPGYNQGSNWVIGCDTEGKKYENDLLSKAHAEKSDSPPPHRGIFAPVVSLP